MSILRLVMFITSPPAIQPMGTVMRPASTPAPRKGRSCFLMMDRATGMVKTMVGPIMLPRIRPAKLPVAGSPASCMASG